MKKILIAIIILMSANVVSAQQDTTAHQDTVWRSGGIFAVNFSQVSLTHWAGGGQNAVSLNAIANYFAHYKRAKNSWDNDFNLGYGFTMQDNSPAIKNDDRIDLTTKYGREASGHWYYSSLLNFRSQFTNGYNYPNDSTVLSKFLAPGYILLALGMDFKPTNNFSMFVSPATARFIIVDDDSLSAHGRTGRALWTVGLRPRPAYAATAWTSPCSVSARCWCEGSSRCVRAARAGRRCPYASSPGTAADCPRRRSRARQRRKELVGERM